MEKDLRHIRDISVDRLKVLDGWSFKGSKRSLARAASSSLREFQGWIVSVGSIGAIHKSLKEHIPVTDALHRQTDAGIEILVHPVDVIDHKVAKWQALWRSGSLAFQYIMDVCAIIRDHARIEQIEPLTIADLRQAAAAMRPKAGLGIDQMSPLDFDRLPDCAVAEL
eukprot:381461-Pyramimonas_sp.AAC.1